MLTYQDEPTIRNAILKRLDRERGVEIHDLLIRPKHDAIIEGRRVMTSIAVGILATLDHALVIKSRFDLPPSFDYRHLHNEIDEIAEQYKSARRDFWAHGRVLPKGQVEREMSGTGLRGRWAQYG